MSELFQDAFHAAAIGMAIVSQEGRFIRVNRAYCQIVGYSEEEVLGLSFQQITHPEDLDADLAYMRRMLRGEIETYEMEKRYLHKDGRIVWVLLSVSHSSPEDGSPGCFFAQTQDITARKRAESHLLAALEVKRRLYDELRLANEEMAKLQEGLVTICAWTKQIRDGEEWKPIEAFLTERLRLKLTHGISEEGMKHMHSENQWELFPPGSLGRDSGAAGAKNVEQGEEPGAD